MSLILADRFFQTGNYIDAGLWIVIGVAFAGRFVWTLLRRSRSRTSSHRTTHLRTVLAAFVFIAFGLSDVVEAGTGAWWRPWWLFAWKAACVVCLAGLLWDYARRRRKPSADSS